MKTHELAQKLLSLPDGECIISVDISTGEKDAFDRVFSDEFLGINSSPGEIILLFSGAINK